MNDIGSSFQESATQSAFVTLAAHHTNLESTLRLHSQKLDVLTQRTEPLPPSHQREQLPTDTMAHIRARTTSALQATHFLEDPPALPRPPLAPILHASASPAEVAHLVRLPTHAVNEAVRVSGPIPTMSGSEALTLVPVVYGGGTHTVLRLLPGPSLPYTAFDMILPEPAAFCDPMDMTADRYPTFTSRNCNWTSIFATIKQPALL